MAAAAPVPVPCVVGALACQRDSYLHTLHAQVISCTEYMPPPPAAAVKSKSAQAANPARAPENGTAAKTWLVEFSDSVLFPEGGGQPTDRGTVTPLPLDTPESSGPVPIRRLQRHGLRCLAFSPQPLAPGTQVRQHVDFQRRWDHMQQHTGQHLLSAIMDSMGLETLSWTMGAEGEMNYVELPRKPTSDQIRTIQGKCNEAIRSNLPITVETPEFAKADSLPSDYDKEKGVVRYIKIGDLDYNACCGTHLKQTSHISFILLHHTQTIRSTNCRLFFSAGDRAISLATASVNSLRSIAVSLSSGSAPSEVESSVQRLNENVSDLRKSQKKLLAEIARYEGERVRFQLQARKSVWSYRATDGLDFINLVVFEIKDAVKEQGAVILASGEDKGPGSIMIIGETSLVDDLSAKVKAIVSTVKGGGKGKWQGKVAEWKKGEIEALRNAVQG